MAETLPRGVVIPQQGDAIGAEGVSAMRALGTSADTAITAAVTEAKFPRGLLSGSGPYDLFALDTGVYTISNATAAGATANIPEVYPGVAVVLGNTGSPVKTIQYYPHQRSYWYTTNSQTFTTMQPWRRVDAVPEVIPGMSTDLGQAHAARRAIFRRRRGGFIGTGGKPVIALRWDHGLNNFKDLVLPHLIRLGLPGSIAMNSADNRWSLSESDQVTPAMLDGYATAHGIEVWNHSQTHGSAEDLASLTREIVTGLADLQAQIPSVPIEGFVIPGVPSGNYAGFSAGEDAARWDTIAGRLIMGYHAVSSSHLPGTDNPLTGDEPILGRQYGIDSVNAATAIASIDRAVSRGSGQIVFLHPSQLDLDGRITTADYVSVLEHIAALRDAGTIEILTMGGMSIADTTRAHRHDLITDGTFTGGTAAWGSPADWTVGADGSVTTGVSSSSLAQTVDFTGREWVKGSSRDLVVSVQARNGSGVVNLEITRGSTVRQVSIPDGAIGWTDVHVPGIIPLSQTSETIRIRRVSGSYLHVRSVRWLAV